MFNHSLLRGGLSTGNIGSDDRRGVFSDESGFLNAGNTGEAVEHGENSATLQDHMQRVMTEESKDPRENTANESEMLLNSMRNIRSLKSQIMEEF